MPASTSRDHLLVRLSNLFFALTGSVVIVYLAIFLNPGWVPGPLRPPTPVPSSTSLPTATPTLLPTATSLLPSLPAPWTKTPTLVRTATSVFHLKPTEDISPTRRPTRTPTLTPTKTRIPSKTISPYHYTLQDGFPTYSAYPGGCNWMGFAGQVLDSGGQRVVDLVIHIGGPDYLVLSGSAQEYGIKGWVQKVANQPANTNGAYTLQVLDTLGNPLSSTLSVQTFKDCSKNLVTVNFVQNH
jgi:hypothetical protein